MLSNSFRSLLIITLSFLIVKDLAMVVLLGDFSSLISILVHFVLVYLIYTQHTYARNAVFFWALFYLFIMTGVKAGGKTLVILSGNAWEINMLRYGIDLFLVVLGIIILFLSRRLIN